MEKKTILAIAICIGIWLLWSMFFMEPPKKPVTPDGGTLDGSVAAGSQGMETPPADATGPTDAAPKEEAPAERPEAHFVTLKNDLFEATFTSRGARLKALKLAAFHERDEAKPNEQLGPENLVSTEKETRLPLGIRFRTENSSFKLGSYTDWRVISHSAEEVVFGYTDPSDANIPIMTKRFKVQPGSYVMQMDVHLENRSEGSVTEQLMVDLFANYAPPVKTGCVGAPSVPRSPMCMKGEEVVPSSSGCSRGAQLNPGEARTEEPNIHWTGINEQYFLTALIPVGVDRSVCHLEARHDNLLMASLMVPERVIPPGGSTDHQFRVYAGPKQMKLLEQVQGGPGDGKGSAQLTASVNYGWFSFLCHPMLWLLKVFYSFLGNYGLAIILLTIVIKVVLLPLTHKSMKSMAEMSKLRPLMDELKKKYGDDKQRLNQEMMGLYKTHKINPMGGCFPMLLQMPIWIALYRMLYSSVELYQAPFIPGWLGDLSFRDPYFILPVVLGGTMFLQQKLSPTSADSQQAKMMLYIMPAFFTFIMLYLPSGLVLYIFVNSGLSIAHQLYYNKKLKSKPVAEPPPAKG